MMIGSQRAVNESFPRSIHAQIPARWVGRVLNSGEAAFASGTDGCDAHRLPGKGAAMIYEPGASGVRLQSLFVADANRQDYGDQVARFVVDIQKRWPGIAAHWRLGWQPDAPTMPTGGAVVMPDMAAMVEAAVRRALLDMATVTAVPVEDGDVIDMPDTSILDEIDGELLRALEVAYDENPDGFNKKRLRDIGLAVTGKRMKTDRESAVFDAFLAHVRN